jgi:hypothetical protein
MSFQKKDLRRYERELIDAVIRILWEDADGREQVSRAKIANISSHGIAFRADQAIPLRSPVSCNEEKLGIRGRGTVRHCTFLKGKYEIGVEFSGGTGWPELIAKMGERSF